MRIKKLLRRRRENGAVLPETIVSLGISGLMTAVLCSIMSFSSHTFASMWAYMDLNKESKQALDIITRDVRQVTELTSYNSNQVDFLWVDSLSNNNHLTLTYNPATKTLNRSFNYGRSEVLVTGCEPLPGTNLFRVYQRTPEAKTWNNYDPSTANFTKTAKVVLLAWKASRTNVANVLTETVQTAKIVMRSQH